MSTLVEVTQELEVLNESQFRIMEATDNSDYLLKEINSTLISIEESILDFLDIVPKTVDEGFVSLVEADAKSAKMENREDEIEEQKKKKKKKDDTEGFFSPFAKSIDDAPSVTEFLGNFIPITAMVASLSYAFGVLVGTILPAIPLILGVAAAIAGIVAGLDEAMDYFNNQEGSLGDKILAGIEGFLVGFSEFFLKPLDWVKDILSDGAKKLFGENNKISDFLDSFSFFEKFRAIIRTVFVLIGDVVESFQALLEFAQPLIDKLSEVISWISSKLDLIPDWLKSDAPKTDLTALSDEETNDAMDEVSQNSFYEKNLLGKSTIDESMLESATAKQLQAIVEDNDLSSDQMRMVQMRLEKITQTGVHRPAPDYNPHDPTNPPPLSPQEQKKLDSFKKTAPPPTNVKFSVVNPESGNAVLYNDNKTATVAASAIGSEVRVVSSGGNLMQSALNPQPQLQVSSPSATPMIFPVGDRVSLSQTMATENSRLSNNMGVLEDSRSTASSVAVNAPSTSNVSNNTTVNSGTPSAVDKSDRTSMRTGRR